MKILLFILLMFSTIGYVKGQTSPKRITFNGVYLSIARTAPIDKWKRFNRSDINLEVTTIVGISKRWSLQFEIIYPIGTKPFLRTAIAVRGF